MSRHSESGTGPVSPTGPAPAAATANEGRFVQQQVVQQPAGRGVAEEKAEQDEGDMPAGMRQMLERMQQQMQQQQQAQQQMQQQMLSFMEQQDRRYQEQHKPAGEYSAAASLPLPPRAQAPNRTSFGRPSTPAAYLPFTPAARRVAAVRPSPVEEEVGEVDQADVTAVVSGMPARDRDWHQVRKIMSHTVKTFHGQTTKDTYTVLDWVAKVDTEFSILMGVREAGRLDIVRSLLAGTALQWVNNRMQEAIDDGQQVEWQQVRGEFIDAHLGASTVETFKAELRALVLGSEGCKNPSELNAQFDALAGLAFPASSMLERRLDTGRASTLGEVYAQIVAHSKFHLYTRIVENVAPTTLDEWKAALSRYWAGEQAVKIMRKQIRPQAWQPENKGSGWPGKRTQATVSALQDSDADMEGEKLTVEGEGEPQQQLKAAAGVGKASGGRGRERDRGRAQFSTEQRQKLYDEGRCFNCQGTGHIAAKCPKPSQQGKGKAGQ